MTHGSYKQFCPVAMAAEVLSTRWTVLLLRELVLGSTRFNELRRGLARMSPALLSQRLKELEAAGIVRRIASATEAGVFEYHLTPSGRELKAVVIAFGVWGQRWAETEASLRNLDVSLLMWDMRRHINLTPLPKRRSVIQFRYPELPPPQRSWWLIADPVAPVDIGYVDPGLNVDLYVTTDLRTMTAIWMGLEKVCSAVASEQMVLTGDRGLAADMQAWLGLCPFATEQKLAS